MRWRKANNNRKRAEKQRAELRRLMAYENTVDEWLAASRRSPSEWDSLLDMVREVMKAFDAIADDIRRKWQAAVKRASQQIQEETLRLSERTAERVTENMARRLIGVDVAKGTDKTAIAIVEAPGEPEKPRRVLVVGGKPSEREIVSRMIAERGGADSTYTPLLGPADKVIGAEWAEAKYSGVLSWCDERGNPSLHGLISLGFPFTSIFGKATPTTPTDGGAERNGKKWTWRFGEMTPAEIAHEDDDK